MALALPSRSLPHLHSLEEAEGAAYMSPSWGLTSTKAGKHMGMPETTHLSKTQESGRIDQGRNSPSEECRWKDTREILEVEGFGGGKEERLKKA